MKPGLVDSVASATGPLSRVAADELAAIVGGMTSSADADRLAGLASLPTLRGAAHTVAELWRQSPETTPGELSALLRGAAAAQARSELEETVDVVMTGPSEPEAPTRSTEAVVVDLVNSAQRELLLVTFAAFHFAPLTDALIRAISRGVSVVMVVETVEGAGGMLHHDPAAAFAAISGIRFFQWPTNQRSHGGRMHAKLVVVDRKRAFVTSANLTGGAMENNLECGLLVAGRPVASRLADHFAILRREGVLVELRA